MPKTPTTQDPARGSEAERVRAAQPEGAERTWTDPRRLDGNGWRDGVG
jgi:hypothetical protein